MASQEIGSLLKNQKAFFAAFPDIKSFSEYRDENGNNLFHLMQRQSSPAFIKRAYSFYSKMDKRITDNMLIERNNENKIPANFGFPPDHINPDDYKPSSADDKRHYENYRLLKKFTKMAFYPGDSSMYYAPGVSYAAGISNAATVNGGENGFSMITPTYPTIRLVMHDYSTKTTKDGFSTQKGNETKYINFHNETYIGGNPESKNPFARLRKPRKRVNQGEILEIRALPINPDVSLSQQLKDVLLFPEDYAFAAQTLDTVGTEIKMYHGNGIMSPVIRDFKKDGGVIQIENTEIRYSNSNGKGNEYLGLNTPIYAYDFSRSLYLTSIVSMNAKYDSIHTNKFSTLAHELTHHADLRGSSQIFSESQLMDYMMALYCASPDPNQSLYGNFKFIADGYKAGNFNSEALANLVSQYNKDEFMNKTAAVFSRFAEAKANNDLGTVQFIMQQSPNYVKNREFLDAMVDDFKKSNTSSKKMEIYRARYANRPEMSNIISEFMKDMDNITSIIDVGKMRTPINTDEYAKKVTGYSENDIRNAFWETSEKLRDAPRVSDKYQILAEQCEKTVSSGCDKIETYKLAMIVANIEKKLNIPLTIRKNAVYDNSNPNSRIMPDTADYDFSTPGSFEYIQRVTDPRQLTGIVRDATKLRNVLREAQKVPDADVVDIKIALDTSAKVADIRSSIDRAKKDAAGKTDTDVSKMLTDLVKSDAKENDPGKRLDLIIRTFATAKELYARKGQEVPPHMDIKKWDLDAAIKGNVRLCHYDFFNKEIAALQKMPPQKVKTLNPGFAYASRPGNNR